MQPLMQPIWFFFGSFVVWGLLVIGYDISQLLYGGMQATISYQMYYLARTERWFSGAFGFGLGVLIIGLGTHFWSSAPCQLRGFLFWFTIGGILAIIIVKLFDLAVLAK